MSVRRLLPTSSALIVLLVAACASTAPSRSPSPPVVSSATTSPSHAASPSPSPTAAALLLKVTSEGGFIGPSATLAALPAVAVYADGRIFLPGAIDAIYPAPLLQSLSVRDVGPTGAKAIAEALTRAGLDKPGGGDPGVAADAGTTVFTVVAGGETVTTRFTGIGGGPGKPGGGNPAAAAVVDLLARLTDPAETWGAASAPETTDVPAGFRIFVAPGGPAADPGASQSPMAWPLATPLGAFGTPALPDRGITGLRSGVVTGSDATALAPFLARASVLTPITSGGQAYTLYVRPLLPDESGGG